MIIKGHKLSWCRYGFSGAAVVIRERRAFRIAGITIFSYWWKVRERYIGTESYWENAHPEAFDKMGKEQIARYLEYKEAWSKA